MEKSKTILVIDDVEENVDIIRQKLSHLGYSVLEAFDGEQGLNVIQQHVPNLVLCDIMLPKLDGWEILSAVRKDPKLKHIPMILMTAYTTIQFRGERKRAIELGAIDYLKKPFDLSEMASLIEKHLV
jgi:CheY-like chemotaxis protein